MADGDVLVDDHLLLRCLLDDEPPDLRPRGGRLCTTGLWYHRLCRAMADPSVIGVMSRRLAGSSRDLASRAQQSIIELPPVVTVSPLRRLAWPMAALVTSGVRLNLMSLEALAAAEELRAEICLAPADQNPSLLAAASTRGIVTRIVGGRRAG